MVHGVYEVPVQEPGTTAGGWEARAAGEVACKPCSSGFATRAERSLRDARRKDAIMTEGLEAEVAENHREGTGST
eukprot:2366646-Amphidinium_carterae.2